MTRRLSLLVFFIAAAAAAQQQNSDSTTVNASAAIVKGLAITKTSDLLFGDIVPDAAAAGTVTISPASARSTTTVTVGNGPVSAASFDIATSGGGNKHFAIELPASITITSGSNSMTVDTFTSNYPAPPPLQTAPFTLNVGATLHVAASQPAGTYSGSFTITAIQQ